jgi:hypothetical protein
MRHLSVLIVSNCEQKLRKTRSNHIAAARPDFLLTETTYGSLGQRYYNSDKACVATELV